MCPFQCDDCIFYIFKHRLPDPNNPRDPLLQRCIRRINLDAMWAREPGTVEDNRREVETGIETAKILSIDPPYWPMGPIPPYDTFGYGVALTMVYRSLSHGKYADYLQFGSIRKVRSAFSNCYMASVTGHENANRIGRAIGKLYLTKCPTQSLWFGRFSEGRMGQIVKQDLGVSIKVLHELLRLIKEDIRIKQGLDKYMLFLTGTFVCICFCGSFRGHEVFLVDLGGLLQ